jgi:hypothetical protein
MNLSQITTIYRLIAGDSDSDWGHGKWQASSWQASDSIYWLFQPAFHASDLKSIYHGLPSQCCAMMPPDGTRRNNPRPVPSGIMTLPWSSPWLVTSVPVTPCLNLTATECCPAVTRRPRTRSTQCGHSDPGTTSHAARLKSEQLSFVAQASS